MEIIPIPRAVLCLGDPYAVVLKEGSCPVYLDVFSGQRFFSCALTVYVVYYSCEILP